MIKTLKKAFQIQEIRNRILFVFFILVVVRIGCEIPVPGVNTDYIASLLQGQAGDAFNFFDAIIGGSFMSMSIFALNISPYITSSIVVQLLTIAIPKLEELQKDGEDGRKKLDIGKDFILVVALCGAGVFCAAVTGHVWRGGFIDCRKVCKRL